MFCLTDSLPVYCIELLPNISSLFADRETGSIKQRIS